MDREHLGKLTGERGVRRLTDRRCSQWKGRDEVIAGGAEGAGAYWAGRGGASTLKAQRRPCGPCGVGVSQ